MQSAKSFFTVHTFKHILVIKLVLLIGACLFVNGCSNIKHDSIANGTGVVKDTTSSGEGLKPKYVSVATWNVEHLAFPASLGCKARSDGELSALQEYAKTIKADIVGLQEVASIEAVRLLFPESKWQIVMSERPDTEAYECRESGSPSTQQKIAFAVKNAIDVKDVIQHNEFGLDSPGLRWGLEIKVDSVIGKVSLLNVHLKSGCFVDNYSRSDRDSCATFAKQFPILDAWVESKEQSKKPYIMLGDFNHRLSAPYNHATMQLFSNLDNSESSLQNTTAQMIGCHPYYPAPIDHIFVGNMLNLSVAESTSIYFDNMEPGAMLSDHCAITATLVAQ